MVKNFVRQFHERKKRLRRWWVKRHIRDCMDDRLGAYKTLFLYFEQLFRMTRMTVEQFRSLHDILRDY